MSAIWDSGRRDFQSDAPAGGGDLEGARLSHRAVTWSLAAILAVVFLAYLNTLRFDFVHDDRFQILGNTWLRAWRYLPRYFAGSVWAFQHPGFRGTYYRPAFLLWFRIQYLLFGTKPFGWHLCTIACHLGATILAYFTAARLLEDRLAALFTALIFGLHPTHAEAVAWVSGVTEPLFAVFLLSSYIFYLKQRTNPGRSHAYLAGSLAFYVLACFSKETAVIMPLIIFASEMMLNGRRDHAERGSLRRSLDALKVIAPYLALLAVYIVARIVALRGFQFVKEDHSYLSMILTWPSVIWFYIRHLFWPVGLNPFYADDFVTHWDVRTVVLPAIPVVIAGLGLWLWIKASPKAAVAALWMVVPVLPVLDLRAFISGQLVHDRYLYLPSFGFAMLMALAVRRLRLGPSRMYGQLVPQLALMGTMVVAMMCMVVRATACYADQDAFITYVNQTSAKEHIANMDLATLLGNRGHLTEAIQVYQQLLVDNPDSWNLNYNLGYAYYVIGKIPEADRYLTHAMEIDPNLPDGLFYLGLTKLKLGDVNAAAAYVQRAIMINPDADHYHFAMGIIRKLQGNLPGAVSEFKSELEIDPDNSTARQQIEEIESGAGGSGNRPSPNGSIPPSGTDPSQ